MKRKQITAVISAVTMLMGSTVYGAGNVSAAQESKADQSTLYPQEVPAVVLMRQW